KALQPRCLDRERDRGRERERDGEREREKRLKNARRYLLESCVFDLLLPRLFGTCECGTSGRGLWAGQRQACLHFTCSHMFPLDEEVTEVTAPVPHQGGRGGVRERGGRGVRERERERERER